MDKYRYLKRNEKEEFMALGCLMATLESIITRLEEYKGNEKNLIKNFKTALTFTRKGFSEMTEAMNPDLLLELSEFIENKKVLICDPKDARFAISQRDKEELNITIQPHIFESMVKEIKKENCQKCQGKSECAFRGIMMANHVDGQSEFELCPFVDKIAKDDIIVDR